MTKPDRKPETKWTLIWTPRGAKLVAKGRLRDLGEITLEEARGVAWGLAKLVIFR